MPRTLPLSAVQPKLAEPVAVVTRPTRSSWPSEPGTAKDRTLWMAPDFDAPLEDFAEYME